MKKMLSLLSLITVFSQIAMSQSQINDFKYFIVTANASGVLATPNMGTFAFNANGFPFYNGWDRPQPGQQSTNTSLWGIATGNTSPTMDISYAYFISRVTRAGANWPKIIPYDFEIRFTTAGSKGKMAFSSGSIVQLPFELWNTGIGTPNDPTDDYKLVAYIFDANANEVFDLDKVDHTLSGGDNDPETDWIYIYDVADHTPGTSGYNAVVASGFNSGIGIEIMARVVLVNWNGGSVSAANWPNNLNATLPENGTVFRMETYKPTTDLLNEFVIPLNYELFQNYPNPFNPTTKLRFGLPERTNAKLTVYDILGRAISTLVDGEFEAGHHEVNFDASNLPSGVYFYQLSTPNYNSTKKLLLMK